MKKAKKTLKTKEKGITLIALVVTIIVLLILAGISIAMLTGENGILNRAKEANEKTEIATEKEQRQLTIAEATMNLNGTKYKSTYKGEEVTVPIPAGFAVSQVDGENTVEDGLVIIDSKGNEFVWIPVERSTFDKNFKRTIGYEDNNLQTGLNKIGEANELGINNYLSETEITQQEAKHMYASVKENEGFYIGRYETGKDDEGNIVSKKGVLPYVDVKWGNNITDESEGAVYEARKFAISKGYTSVVSTLCYGVQWDMTLNFMDSDYITNGNPNCKDESYVRNSTGCGNYNEESNTNEWKNSITETGKKTEYSEKNIYDMAGNVSEWTMESYNTDQRIRRGGSWFYSGAKYPVSSRILSDPNSNNDGIGFRITLYLK